MLEKSDCQVFLVNMLEYVLMTKPLALSDFILSLMADLVGKAEESIQGLAPLSQSYWERLIKFLTSEVNLETIDVESKVPGAASKLGFKLKTDPEFKSNLPSQNNILKTDGPLSIICFAYSLNSLSIKRWQTIFRTEYLQQNPTHLSYNFLYSGLGIANFQKNNTLN